MRARDVSATDTKGRGGGGGGGGGGASLTAAAAEEEEERYVEDTKERKGFSIPARRKRVVLSLSLVLVVLPQGGGGRASLNLDTQTRVLGGRGGKHGGKHSREEGHKCRERGIALALQVGANSGKIGFFSLAGRRAAATKRAAEKIEQGGNITGVRSSTGNNDIGIATKNDVAKRVPCIHPAY